MASDLSNSFNLLPPVSGRFSGAAKTEADKKIIAAASVLEALDKKERLRAFFDNPFGDSSKKFHLAHICLDYLEQFKPEGKLRKDKVTQNILHELNQTLRNVDLYRAGYLPDEITYQKINGVKKIIPKAQQSIELLFCATLLHDLDEDFADSSPEDFLKYASAQIKKIPAISNDERTFIKEQANFAADSMRALTFGRKVPGQKEKKETHGGRLVIYMEEMKNFWAAIAAKAQDKSIGLGTRFSRSPVEGMSVDETMNYLSETRLLFMSAQPLEDMRERYPQLSEYFDILNKQIRIALVCLDTLIQHHPELSKDRNIRGRLDPHDAQISISRYLETAMKAAPYTTEDVCPMFDLMEGFYAEAQRHPDLMPIYDKIWEQVEPHTHKYGSAYKIIPEKNRQPVARLG